jgi:murein DD-endopeptidase MepM/ murein hydrolase activator NlpD
MGGYGLAVIIDHGSGRATLYGHCSQINCKTGDVVKVGEKIAEVGSTGYSTGPHCHFEVRINGKPVDPMKEL